MNNFRMTAQKRIILEELKKTKKHPTAEQLYYKVKERLPEISIGTVYRNLEVISKSGKARIISDGGRKKRFDGNTDIHYHLKCINCDKVEDIPRDMVDVVTKDGFELDHNIKGYSLLFYGLCLECKKSKGE